MNIAVETLTYVLLPEITVIKSADAQSAFGKSVGSWIGTSLGLVFLFPFQASGVFMSTWMDFSGPGRDMMEKLNGLEKLWDINYISKWSFKGS